MAALTSTQHPQPSPQPAQHSPSTEHRALTQSNYLVRSRGTFGFCSKSANTRQGTHRTHLLDRDPSARWVVQASPDGESSMTLTQLLKLQLSQQTWQTTQRTRTSGSNPSCSISGFFVDAVLGFFCCKFPCESQQRPRGSSRSHRTRPTFILKPPCGSHRPA